jgi:hypothetical protein
MSNPESFIDEVSEEVRRDRVFGVMKRYGWIGVLVVLGIVGGTGWREYSRAQEQASAQAFGDAMLDALEVEAGQGRVDALAGITAPGVSGDAVLQMLIAAEESGNEDGAAAAARLQALAANTALPQIYRQIASYKALTRSDAGLDADTRRAGFEALAVPGQPLRLLAEEQLALIEIETGARDAALTRLRAIAQDAEATAGLRRRASQLIVSLGGTLDGVAVQDS